MGKAEIKTLQFTQKKHTTFLKTTNIKERRTEDRRKWQTLC